MGGRGGKGQASVERGQEQQRQKNGRRRPTGPRGMNRSRGKGARWTPVAHVPRNRSSASLPPKPHAGRSPDVQAPTGNAKTGRVGQAGGERPRGGGSQRAGRQLARRAHATPNRLQPLLSKRTRVSAAPPDGIVRGPVGSASPGKTLPKMESRAEDSQRVPRNAGPRVSNFARLGRGARGAEGRTY